MVFTWHFFVCLIFHLWTVLTFTICTLHLPINWPSCGWVELWEKGVVAGENCRPFTDDRKRINWYYSLELKNSQFLDLYASAGRCFSRISEPFLSLSREKSVSKWEELRKMDTKRLLLSHFFVSAVNCNYFPLDFLSQWGGDKGELCYALKPKYSSRGFYCS